MKREPKTTRRYPNGMITKREALRWFDREVRKAFAGRYTHLLNSGAVDKREARDGYTFARCVLLTTAPRFQPLSEDGRAMLKNLECF